jgi:DnaK suppressor protein
MAKVNTKAKSGAKKPAPKPKAKPVGKAAAKTKSTAKTTTKAAPTKTTTKATTPAMKPISKAAPAPALPTPRAISQAAMAAKPKVHINAPGSTIVPPDYKPCDKEEFMNPVMLEYFRLKLLRWKAELVREAESTVHETLQGTELQKPDLVDRASEETDHALELRTRDRERKLIAKIEEALLRIEDGSYGFCEETGEPISVGRLDARPIATLSIEAQERHERKERTQRDD